MQNIPPNQENYNAPSDTAPSLGTSSENMDGKSSTGFKPNIAAALSYALIWIIGLVCSLIQTFIIFLVTTYSKGAFKTEIIFYIAPIISALITLGAGFIFFLMEKESRFVRLHSMQAILVGVLWFAVPFLFYIVFIVLYETPPATTNKDVAYLAVIAYLLLGYLVSLTFLVIWILLMVKAYMGGMLKLPVISYIAKNIVTK
jgi:uncharacterized membrane protein